jgi:hypothetical protein
MESNHQPPLYESGALPIELRWHRFIMIEGLSRGCQVGLRGPRLLDFARTCQRHFVAARVLFRVAAEHRDALYAPKPITKPPPFAAVSADVRDVEKMAHLCHGPGVAFLAVLQRVLGLSGKEMTAAKRQALAHAIDDTELFAGLRDECFRDEAHFTDLGERRAAEFIADAIRRHDLLGDPEAARQAPEIVGRGW